jgi:GNAT superfamily N-acetyltransferase
VSEIDFRDAVIDAGDGALLERAMVAEMAELYDGFDISSEGMPKAGPQEMNPPSGRFLVGYEDDRPICCGGIKRLDDESCEIKRMYVVPDARGRGVAKALLRALEDRARAAGYLYTKLDTGPRQAGAQRLYESVGYAPTENFNGNPVAVFFGAKRL